MAATPPPHARKDYNSRLPLRHAATSWAGPSSPRSPIGCAENGHGCEPIAAGLPELGRAALRSRPMRGGGGRAAPGGGGGRGRQGGARLASSPPWRPLPAAPSPPPAPTRRTRPSGAPVRTRPSVRGTGRAGTGGAGHEGGERGRSEPPRAVPGVRQGLGRTLRGLGAGPGRALLLRGEPPGVLSSAEGGPRCHGGDTPG